MTQGTTPPADPDATPPADPDATPPADVDPPAKHAVDAPAGSNTALPVAGDRVSMLSLRSDGTPDQVNPEFIDPAAGAAATAEQFKQQAVSAVDTDMRREQPANEPEAVQDSTVAALTEAHEAAAADADAAAQQAVEDLTR